MELAVQKTECEIHENRETGASASAAARIHGGNVRHAAKQYGLNLSDITDFSSNVNPLGPSSAAVRAARKAMSQIDRYPEPGARQLRMAVARYYGIKPEQVVCDSGSTALIHLIPRVFRPRKVLIPVPTFSEYAAAASSAGAEVISLQLPERTGFRIDPLEMAFALKGVDMAFLCNPNNPTGLLMPKLEMLEIAKYALDLGVRIVIDEAYMDFANADSVAKEAVQSSQLICLRTFSTFFGMPGLRIGYALAGEAVIAALESGQEPWSVNLPAEQAAIAALNDWRHTRRTVRLMEKERDRLLSALRIMPGIETFPGAANFIFLKVAAEKAPLLAEKLALRGLLVRDCSSFPGLDSRFIRLAVRSGRENKRFLRALRELLGR
jgi:threonine-phosphate decarboxylase